MKTIKIIGSKVARPITLNTEATTWDQIVVELAEQENFSTEGLRAQTISENPTALTSGSSLPVEDGGTLMISLAPVKNDNGLN